MEYPSHVSRVLRYLYSTTNYGMQLLKKALSYLAVCYFIVILLTSFSKILIYKGTSCYERKYIDTVIGAEYTYMR